MLEEATLTKLLLFNTVIVVGGGDVITGRNDALDEADFREVD